MFNKKKYAINILFAYVVAFIKRFFQLLFIATRSDICFFQKACIPKSSFNVFKWLKRKKIRIIFDVDDAIYTGKRDFSDMIAKFSDIVICGNETLVQHYRDFSSNVILLPTIENTNLFRPYWKDTFDNKTIGWIGSMTTIDNLDIVVNPINRIVEKYPQVNFLIISNSALDYTSKIKNTRLVKWNNESYISDLSSISVGIMPLKDNEVNRGKCGFKLIQYLNLKKPVIASDVGVNREIVANNGFLANSEDNWYVCLEKLLFSSEEYEKKVQYIEKEFLEKYNYSKNVNRLIEILNG
jgi:glycosyltransferase involved in cell wall biosynthesis